MKNLFTSALVILLVSASVFCQPPQAFKYQAVVRNASGEIVANQPVGVQISIRNNDVAGPIIYQETHAANTNDFGLMTLNIGMGTPVGSYDFETITWEQNAKFVEVEVDPLGGTNYISMGVSELLSVPYSLFSGSSADGYWDKSNDEIYYNGGNVGIGTTNPATLFHVYGNGLFREGESGVYIGTETDYGVIGYSSPSSGAVRFKLKPGSTVFSGRVGILSTGDPDYTFHIKEYGGGDWLAGIHNLGTNTSDKGLLVRSDGGDPFWVQYGASTLFAIKNTGNVGIGTTEPDNRLVIKSPGAGDVLKILSNTNNTLAKFRHTGNGSGSLYLYDDSNNNTVFLYGLGTSFINGGSLGLGTSSVSNAKLQIEGTGTYDAMIKINNTGTNGASFFMGSTNDAWGGGANQNLFVMGHGAPSSANIDMVITSTGRLGIGTTTPTAALEVSSASGNVIYGHSPGGTAVYGSSGTSTGVYGQSSSGFAGFFSGSVYVSGSLSKGSGSFVIDHPLDPENKLLRHNFVESPENLLIYRGKAQLNANGEAIVEMPDYFKALTKEDEATIVVTSIGRPFMTGYEWENGNQSFKVYGDPNRSVSWIVCADRDDPVIHELGRPVEEEKGGDNKFCEKGKLLYPKAYGYPESYGRDYEMTRLNTQNK